LDRLNEFFLSPLKFRLPPEPDFDQFFFYFVHLYIALWALPNNTRFGTFCWASGRAGGLYAKAFHYFQAKREEFESRYHKRSNIESTFSMLKAKFGDSVRSKTDTAMKNEVLAKILCHNICCLISAIYELGIAPTFWKDGQSVSA
jgi:hypothetical protein